MSKRQQYLLTAATALNGSSVIDATDSGASCETWNMIGRQPLSGGRGKHSPRQSASTRFRGRVLFATAALSLGMEGAARAQSTAPTLDEVVVTARRVEERLQDVPISITVFNQEQLTRRNVTVAGDLATYTPSLSANSQFGGDNTTFVLRGFSQQPKSSPTVGVYFADVVAPRGGNIISSGDGAGPGSFFDLQNVQVLKGPQGTLFGRNTTGGAILLVPVKPVDRYEGYVEASAGNYSMKRLQGVINAPITEKVRVRLGFDRQTRDGYLKNVGDIGAEDFGDVNYFAARASVVADLTPELENYTIASYTKSVNHGPDPQLYACNPAAPLFGQLSCNQIAAMQGKGAYAVDNDQPNPQLRLEQWQVINTTRWDVTTSLSIKNIVSYAELRNKLRSSLFGTHWELPSFLGPLAGTTIPFTAIDAQPGGDASNQSTFTEELQFQGHAFDNKLTWQGGGYMEYSRPQGLTATTGPNLLPCTNIYALQCTDVIGTLIGAPGTIGTASLRRSVISYRNLAVYGQATYAITDKLKVTGGLRYTADRTRSGWHDIAFHFPSPNVAVPSCVSALTTVASGCHQEVEQTSSAPTWLVDLEYTPRQDVLTYAKYARGYRQGDVSQFAADGYATFGPEHVDAYEVGAKTSFRGPIPGTFNFAAFYNDFKDQQLQVIFQGPTVAPSVGVVNAGKSRIWGLEAEATASPINGLLIDISYTYLNSRLESLSPIVLAPGGLFTTAVATSLPGDPMPYTPKHKASASIDYKLPLDTRLGTISVGANYVYTDPQLSVTQSLIGVVPAYGLVNLHLDWTSIGGRPVDASFFMTNATNKFYWTDVTDLTNQLGFGARSLGPPRMFGFRLRAHYGS